MTTLNTILDLLDLNVEIELEDEDVAATEGDDTEETEAEDEDVAATEGDDTEETEAA